MKTNTVNNHITRTFATVLTTATLLGSLAAARLPAHADEFTVGHTGADVAFSQGFTGNGVTVAVIDSGVRTAADLQDSFGRSRIQGQVTFASGPSANDNCGHGTHVAGIVAGNGKSSTGSSYFRTFYGTARNANLVNVRVLDNTGQGTVSQVISGIQWCITNKAAYNIRVINLSLGHPVGESYTTDPLCQAVEAAWKAGIVVVCAAGNDGRLTPGTTAGASNEGYGANYGSIQSPGNDPYVITVGATKNYDGLRADDKIATYSSRGPTRLDYVMKPDLIAPGNSVISLCADRSFLDNYAGNTNDIRFKEYQNTNNTGWSNTYFRLSGSSMAAPVVSGAAALLLQKNPTLTPDTIKARLMISADKWTDPSGNYDPCTYGAGYLNIPAALNCTTVPTSSAISPTLVQNAAGNVSISNIIWGTNIIWGLSGVTNPLNVIWGSNIIWGSNVIWGSNIIWGQNVWSDNVIWGTSNSSIDLTSTAIQGE